MTSTVYNITPIYCGICGRKRMDDEAFYELRKTGYNITPTLMTVDTVIGYACSHACLVKFTEPVESSR